MKNTNAHKIIIELQNQVLTSGIDTSDVVKKLVQVREIALELENPVVVKALRLAYEHLEANNDFLIEIPNDEPIDEVEQVLQPNNNVENFNYFLSLLLDINNKHNISDLKEINNLFTAF